VKRQALLLPSAKNILNEMGENLRLARLRRKISAQQVAERANISRSTLWMIEKGSPAVAMGAYMQVLFVLGLENDLLKIAGDDVLGKKLRDLELLPKQRAPKRKNNEQN
jgi:transcriptional regulator with XRE-family HTH domain